MRDETDTDPLQLHDIVDAASVVHVTVERLFRLLKAQMAAALAEQGSSIVEWRILLMLRLHGEMAQKDLVHEVAMPQAQVSRALAAMRRRGLIAARRSVRDGRITLFRLTAAGTELQAAVAPAIARRKRTLDGALPPDELDAFMASASRIARAISADAYDRQPPA